MLKKSLLILVLSCLALASFAQADIQKAQLNQDEIQVMVKIFSRLDVKLSTNGACSSSEVVIASIIRGMNKPHWKAVFNDKEASLTPNEIQDVIKIFERAGVEGRTNDGISFEQNATITESGCGMSPSNWTISFVTGTDEER